jgi:hypothetical protein
MNAELEAIRDAWSKETGGGREEELTRQLADEFVAAHPDLFVGLIENSTQDDLVKMIDVFRANGNDEMVWTIQAWLFHHFEPQNIGGVAEGRIRLP